jgi:hypothetical protein
MWAQLGMAGLSALQNQQNKQNNLASNVITQKYSPWTGAQANFSAQGSGGGLGTLVKGAMSGYLQDKADAKEAANNAADEVAKRQADLKSDASFYKQGGVGTPINATPAATGGYAAQRAPAASPVSAPSVPQGNASSFELPEFMQGENPWLAMANKGAPERLPQGADFHQPAGSVQPQYSSWFNSTPLGQSIYRK